jgi:cation diffusion facilitator family transporter
MADGNMKKIQNVLIVILFANLFVAALKIVIGVMIKSNSLTADGFHSLADGASNIVGLVGIWFASKPVDEGHPYGHKKIETLTGMFIGVMLVAVGIKVVYGAINNFINPSIPMVTTESIIAIIITIGINIFVSTYECRAGKKLHSQILISDSKHTRSDIFVSVGVLFTLVALKLGLPPIIDPIASLVVAAFILHAAFEVFNDTIGVLVDKAVVDEEIVKRVALEFNEVKDVHKIRSRGREDEVFIDMHIQLDADMNVEKTHALILQLSSRLQEDVGENVQLITHIEPFRC